MHAARALRIGVFALAVWGLDAQVRYTIHSFAGGGSLGDGGPATQALLYHVEGIAADGAGNIYIADTDGHRIRKVERTGRITTLAGDGIAGDRDGFAARFSLPYGICVDVSGNVYVADLGNRKVRRIRPDGSVTAVPGLELRAPRNVAVARDGSLYVADFEAHRVYRVAADGAVSVAAGSGRRGYAGDGGPAADAALAYPAALAVDLEGALYIGDTGNQVVRRVAGGRIHTVLAATAATGLAVDATNLLWAADSGSGRLLRRTPDGRTAAWSAPARDVAVLADGTVLYSAGAVLRKFEFGLPDTVVAGNPAAIGDGGDARRAVLRQPSALARDPFGNLYVAERGAARIRIIAPDGRIATVNGAPGEIPAALAADAAGNLYVADPRNHRIRRISRSGAVSILAGTGEPGWTGDGGEAPRARLNAPSGVAAAPDGRIWILDAGNAALRVVEGSRIRTVASELRDARGVTALAGGAALVLAGRRGIRIDAAGGMAIREIPGAVPEPLALAAAGDDWLIASAAHRIYRLTPDNRVEVAAGRGEAGAAGDGGPAEAAELALPAALLAADDGAVYVADEGAGRVRVLRPAAEDPPAPAAAFEVRHAATGRTGPLAPGQLALVATAAPDPEIRWNGAPVATARADGAGWWILTPRDAAGSAAVEVAGGGSVTVSIVEAAPGVFAENGAAQAWNQDGTRNGPANPAPRGSVIAFYGTGEGVREQPVRVFLDGAEAEVRFAGPAPGYPGVFQVNIRAPNGFFPAGPQELVLWVGEARSQPGVALWIR
jgi:sugar lactone lactonase YvrE